MANRIATSTAMSRVQADLSKTFNRMADIQSQISTGKRLQKPSDGPAEVASALETRANQRRLEQFATNATDASGWLNVTDGALMSLQEQAAYGKVQLTAAVNGAMDATGRAAIAMEVDNIRTSMVQLANASYQGRFIFGGTAGVGAAPYSTDGAYGGDEGKVQRTVDDGVTLTVNVVGPTVFGAHNEDDPLDGDIFQVLDTLATAVKNGDSATMSAGVQALDAAIERMSAAQIQIGGATQQIERTLARNEMVLEDVKERLSMVEDVDLAESIIGLRSSEAAYQAALGVTARVIQPSLLDFLR